MITFSIIQKSQLEGALRLDAEYYQPEYLENDRKLRKVDFDYLQKFSVIDITKGETPLWRGDEYVELGIPFLRSENLIPCSLDLSNLVFISEKVHGRMKRSKIYPHDVLVAIVGATIGQTGLVTSAYAEYNTNQAIAIIRPENEIVANYLAIVLETKICQLQLERLKGGGARDNLDLHEVKVIKIPKITNQVLKYCNEILNGLKTLRLQSESFYSQAENLLLEELGLKDYKTKEELTCVVDFSEIRESDRIDAEYFQSKYRSLTEVVKRFKHKTLAELGERIKTKIKINPEQIYKYIEISDIDISSGEAKFNEILAKELPVSAQIPIKGGELIVSKVRPTRGAISILPEDFNDNFVCSSAFSVFEVDKGLKEYLFIVLRSVVGNLQLEKPTTGTSYPTIIDQDIENILVPILPKTTQQKIADLVRRSHRARMDAKSLLEEAKRKVEEIVEKGGSEKI